MSTTRRIAKNTTTLFISQVINYVLLFFIFVYMGRYLGPEGFGIINYALALCGILIIICELGLSTLIVREVSRDKSLAIKFSSNVALLKVFLSFITFLIFVLIVYIKDYPQDIANVVYLIGASYIMLTFCNLYNAIFQAFEQMEYISIATILNSVIMLIGVLIAIYYHANITVFAFLFFLSYLIILVYYVLTISWKLFIPKISFDRSFWNYLVKESIPFAMTSVFAVIAFQIDQVLLSLISGNTAVGYYSAAYRLMQALMFLPAVYTTAILPVFSKLNISSKSSLKFGYIKSFKYLTILGLPIAVAVTILSKNLILLIYASGFLPSTIVLEIVIWAIPLIFLNYILGSSIVAIDKQRETVKVIFISMVLNIVLNVIFIPIYSYIAASIITVFTELSTFIWYFRIMYIYGYKIDLNILIKPVIASIVMALFIIFVHTNVILSILIAAIIYFAVLIALKEFSEEDISIIQQIINIPWLINILKKLT